MQTIVYQCDTAMPAQKLPNCCLIDSLKNLPTVTSNNGRSCLMALVKRCWKKQNQQNADLI